MRYLLLLLLLSGCGSFTAKPDKERYILAPRIWWYTVDDPHQACVDRGVKVNAFETIKGCAVMFKHDSSCDIITGKNTSMEVLGHEVRHCFEGKFHE